VNFMVLAQVDESSVPLQIGLALIAGGVVGSVVTRALDSLSRAADRRRERYAATAEHLVAWLEVPYRIRRRVDDDPRTLAALAESFHDLQEHLANDQAWVSAESRYTSGAYAKACAETRTVVQSLAGTAWELPPANSPRRMSVTDLPRVDRNGVDAALAAYRSSIAWRFGWRRAVRPLLAVVMPRLRSGVP
jgi:hypothetical protein